MSATRTPASPDKPHLTVVGTRMSEADYDRERARIAPDKAGAVVRWEQELALLFHRSGWTQEELANKEGLKRPRITQCLLFGRFLAFVTASNNPPNLSTLSEYRFRTAYWPRTAEEGKANERARFAAVLRLIEIEEPMRQAHVVKGHPKRIVEKFGDSKWHPLPIIAKHLGVPDDEAERSLASMVRDGRGGATTEVKKVGTVKHYRIYKNIRMISSTELTDKLQPIIRELDAEGRKSAATVSIPTIATLTSKLRMLLKEWAE